MFFPGAFVVVLLTALSCQPVLSQFCPDQCQCANASTLYCSNREYFPINEQFKQVHLENVTVVKLENLIFKNLTSLTWRNSRIRKIENTSFYNASTLIELDLGSNELEIIRNGVLQPLYSLKRLNLSNNYLRDLPRTMFFDLYALEELHLRGNKLHVIPVNVFAPLSKLRILDLSKNSIVTLHDHFFRQNKNLQSLSLSNNNLSRIYSNALVDLTILEELDLSGNNLESFSKGLFDGLKELKTLHLQYNPLGNLSIVTFSMLHNLQYLDLSHNLIKTLSQKLFRLNNKLETLILDHTKIEVLHNSEFIGLGNLRNLFVRNNDVLQEVEQFVFLDTPHLEILDISGNKLTYLPNTISTLNYLQDLNISENHWTCDCRMHWFANWAENRSKIFNSDLSCGPHSYPNDMIPTLQNLNCTKPRIVHTSPPGLHALKSSALLECSFAGNPHPSVTWITPHNYILHWNPDPSVPDIFHKHPEIHVVNGNSFNRHNLKMKVLENGTLFIQNISREDSGSYYCFATNPIANTTAEVLLYIDPIIIYNVKIMSIFFGAFCAACFLGITLLVQLLKFIFIR